MIIINIIFIMMKIITMVIIIVFIGFTISQELS